MIRGRGVYYLAGEIPCPLAGVGTRGSHDSIRLAFDDDHSEATFDPAARRLVVANRTSYATPTLFGDLIVLGHGHTRDGQVVPVAMHTRFDKSGTSVRARPHLHPTVAGTFASLELEPLEVVIDDRVVLTPELGRRVASRPPRSEWLGRALFSIRSNPTRDAIVDLTVGLGVGRLSVPLVRAELFGRRQPLTDLLHTADWHLQFTVLTRLRDLCEHVGRAVFLLGLDRVPRLRRIAAGQLRRCETLTFRMHAGSGTVEVGGESAIVPDVAAVARAYLEYDILGAVVAQAVTDGRVADEIVV